MDGAKSYSLIRKHQAKAGHARKLDALLADYLALRRSMGIQVRESEYIFRHFLAFLHQQKITSYDRLSRELAGRWLHSGNIQPETIPTRLATMRGFYRYLLGLGMAEENLWLSFTSPRAKKFIPYIYSPEELKLLLDHLLAAVHSRKSSLRRTSATYHVIIHTLYACGLRKGEIRRLTIGDVDFKRSLFLVRNTKFHKSRLVPFNARSRDLLYEYLHTFRLHDDGLRTECPFFLNYYHHAFAGETLLAYFRDLCKTVGLYRPKHIRGNVVHGATNLHALRHSFAVNRLVKWYRDGADVNSKLPLLATYMGHSSYHYTQKYLTVLPCLTDLAGKRFADRFESPLKELE